MKSRILIITQQEDIHSYAIVKALDKKGVKSACWHSSDFPAQGIESIQFINGKCNISISDTEIEMSNPDFSTIWFRRPSLTVNDSILHPVDQKYARYQCQTFRKSLYAMIHQSAFWINSPQCAFLSRSKVLQQNCAELIGLKTPNTLYSNDPDQIKNFIDTNNKKVVFKPIEPALWENKKNTWINYTKVIDKKDLVEDEILKQTPAIYQELIPKKYELRITMMGERAFGAKILSQQTEHGKIDWRQSYDELKMEYWEVPKKLSNLCYALLQKLGLVFGCFDFIVTPKEEWVFLEVNQMGQFLFLEPYIDFPLLDAFTEFLIQGKTDFKWDLKDAIVKYSDVKEEAGKMSDDFLEKHNYTQFRDNSDKGEVLA